MRSQGTDVLPSRRKNSFTTNNLPGFPICVFALIASPAPAASQDLLWSQGFGSEGIIEIGTNVSPDGFGNAFVTGVFESAVDFGGGPLTSARGRDMSLAKYDRYGNHIWSERFGGTDTVFGIDLIPDASGNVFAVGGFKGSAGSNGKSRDKLHKGKRNELNMST